VIQHDFIPHYDSSNLTLTPKAKELKSQNDHTVNDILNLVSERIVILFGVIEITSEI
jgi:hypothetical protein